MFSQKVDTGDWLQGFTVDWIRALAADVARLDVITLERGEALLPDNVFLHSLGKERGTSRGSQFVTFQRTLAGLASHADVFFGHLTPRYTWLAAPLATRYGVPQCLWYTHNHAGLELRMALGCVRWIVTAVPDSFPIRSTKVQVMGHGVDATRFTPGDVTPDDPPLILAVGRIAPIKHHHVFIEVAGALREMGIDARFAIAGAPATEEGVRYQAQLQGRIAALGLGDRVQLLGAVRDQALVALYRRASIVTNLSPVGLFDKAALEAMMTARPVLVTSPAFDSLLGEYADLLHTDSPDQVAPITQKLAVLLRLSADQRAGIGAALRGRAVAAHSLNSLMARLVELWRGSAPPTPYHPTPNLSETTH